MVISKIRTPLNMFKCSMIYNYFYISNKYDNYIRCDKMIEVLSPTPQNDLSEGSKRTRTVQFTYDSNNLNSEKHRKRQGTCLRDSLYPLSWRGGGGVQFC